MKNYKEYIKQIPKIHLHCHIDGSVRPSTILELSKEEGIELPTYDLEDINRLVKIEDKCLSLKDYLTRFSYPINVMQTSKNIQRITLELLEDSAKENIKYVEMRFAPYLHTNKGLSSEEVLEAVIKAKEDGERLYGIKSNIIVSFLRHESEEKNIEELNKIKKFINKGVVAVDLAGNEEDFPPELFQNLFQEAKKLGLHITIHAGETGKEENILKSIELLGAERIGHGTSAYKSLDLEKFLIINKIPLEVCVTSNYNTEIVDKKEDHPVKEFLRKGIKVTISTDNNTVSNVSLTEEFIIAYEKLGFNESDIKNIIKNSIEVSFCSKQEKEELLNILENYQ